MPLFSDRTSRLDALINRPRPSPWHQFVRGPCIFVARELYAWRSNNSTFSTEALSATIVCISDTHNSQPCLPDGDVLIHAGDLTQSGTLEELRTAINWLASQPHPVKIVVAGNHDLLLDAKQDAASNRTKITTNASRSPGALRASLPWNDIIYLDNEGTTITCRNGRRLSVFGSPYSPRHGNWAFQYPRARDVWSGTIPEAVDILFTHTPPRAHCDLNLGCVHLLRELWRVRPRLHVFGHVHAGAGTEVVEFDALQDEYEKTVIAGGGVWNLIRTIWWFLVSLFLRRFTQAGARGGHCTLVNASIVGGLRDDVIRQPITVKI